MATKRVTQNDFLLSEIDREGPLHRGGLDASSVLRHIPQEDISNLDEEWSKRGDAIDFFQFRELMKPIVKKAGYFDDDGTRVRRLWELEGWIPEVEDQKEEADAVNSQASSPSSLKGGLKFKKKRNIDVGMLRAYRRRRTTASALINDSDDEEEDSDLACYLNDIFQSVDTGSKGTITWESFLMFLIDGVRTSVSEETRAMPTAYTFRGELPLGYGRVRKEQTNDYFKYLKFCPKLDKLMGISRNRVVFGTPSGQGHPASWIPVVCRHQSTVTSAEYIPDLNVTISSVGDTRGNPVHFWYHKSHDKAVLMNTASFGLQDTSSTTAMAWSTRGVERLWGGTRSGSLFSTTITQDPVTNQFKLQEVMPLAHSHNDAVTQILTFDTNGHIATSSLDRTVSIFDPISGISPVQISGHTHGVTCMAFNSMFQLLLTAGYEYIVRAWAENVPKTPIFHLEDTTAATHNTIIGVKSVPATPYVITGDSQGVLRIYDLRSKGVIDSHSVMDDLNFDNGLIQRHHVRKEYGNYFSSLEFTGPKHRQIVFGGSRAYRFGREGEMIEDPTVAHSEKVLMAAIPDIDGQVVTISTKDAIVWSKETGAPTTRHIRMTKSTITTAAVKNDAHRIILGHEDGDVTVHNSVTGVQLRRFKYHGTPIKRIAAHPSKPMIFSSSSDGQSVFWEDDLSLTERNVGEELLMRRVNPTGSHYLPTEACSIEFHREFDSLLVCCDSKLAYVYATNHYGRWQRTHRLYHGPSTELQCACFVQRRRVCVCDVFGRMFMWQLEADEPKLMFVWANVSPWAAGALRKKHLDGQKGQIDDAASSAPDDDQLSYAGSVGNNLSLNFSLFRSPKSQQNAMSLASGKHAGTKSQGRSEDEASIDELDQDTESDTNVSEKEGIMAMLDRMTAHLREVDVPSVLCCTYYSAMQFLVTADDLGGMAVWDLTYISQYRSPPGLVVVWEAHDMPMTTMSTSSKVMPIIVTSAHDNKVKLWDFSGSFIASCMQGPLAEREWDFRPSTLRDRLARTKLRWWRLRRRVVDGKYHTNTVLQQFIEEAVEDFEWETEVEEIVEEERPTISYTKQYKGIMKRGHPGVGTWAGKLPTLPKLMPHRKLARQIAERTGEVAQQQYEKEQAEEEKRKRTSGEWMEVGGVVEETDGWRDAKNRTKACMGKRLVRKWPSRSPMQALLDQFGKGHLLDETEPKLPMDDVVVIPSPKKGKKRRPSIARLKAEKHHERERELSSKPQYVSSDDEEAELLMRIKQSDFFLPPVGGGS